MSTDVLTIGYCGLITDVGNVFRQCIAKIPNMAAGHMENCVFDVCANQDNPDAAKEAACGSLEVFAIECLNAGFDVNWRDTAGCRKYTLDATCAIFFFSMDIISPDLDSFRAAAVGVGV